MGSLEQNKSKIIEAIITIDVPKSGCNIIKTIPIINIIRGNIKLFIFFVSLYFSLKKDAKYKIITILKNSLGWNDNSLKPSQEDEPPLSMPMKGIRTNISNKKDKIINTFKYFFNSFKDILYPINNAIIPISAKSNCRFK